MKSWYSLSFKAYNGEQIEQIVDLAIPGIDLGNLPLWLVCTNAMTIDTHMRANGLFIQQSNNCTIFRFASTSVSCTHGNFPWVHMDIETRDQHVIERWESMCLDANITIMIPTIL